jgi:hypothetical protein
MNNKNGMKIVSENKNQWSGGEKYNKLQILLVSLVF